MEGCNVITGGGANKQNGNQNDNAQNNIIVCSGKRHHTFGGVQFRYSVGSLKFVGGELVLPCALCISERVSDGGVRVKKPPKTNANDKFLGVPEQERMAA